MCGFVLLPGKILGLSLRAADIRLRSLYLRLPREAGLEGLTQGRPNDIPIVESDFIFSAITEEFGILFAICLILIYLGVFIHFLKIAMDVRGRFYKLLAYGFSICFIFQVFLTIGGVTKFIPSTGVTLPLISYGGSSVASTLIIFAVMQGIFIIAYKEDDENEEEQAGQPDESDRKKYD